MLELVHNRVNAGFRHSLSRMKISGCDFSNSSHCKLPRAQAVFAMARPKGGSATLEICCELSELQITEQELRAETKEGGRNYMNSESKVLWRESVDMEKYLRAWRPGIFRISVRFRHAERSPT
jgi:hypothetical protein